MSHICVARIPRSFSLGLGLHFKAATFFEGLLF